MSSRTSGTHFQGPILGSGESVKGLFDDVSLGAVDSARSPYKVWVDNFDVQAADGQLEGMGATLTDLNTATSPGEIIGGQNPYLLINPGTKSDAGSSVQFNAAPATGLIGAPFRSAGPIVSTAPLMDNRELFFYTRVGFASDTVAWDGKSIVAWMVDDTTPLATATGVLSIATGGGFGFHVAEDGTLGYFTSGSAVTSATDSGFNVLTDTADAADAGAYVWYTLGARTKFTDASAGTGSTDFYVNGRNVATVADSITMPSTQTYSMTYTIVNGPARDSDLAVDYCITGISRSGITFPYDSGTY